MPRVDFYTAVETGDWVTAGATLAVAFLVAEIVDRALKRRGKRLSSAVAMGELSPVATTRLRLVRRLVFALIILIGVAAMALQFPSVKRVATTLLASSAVLGIVVGFAARATLANAVAGVMLAITQPIRLDDGRRLIVPNELLAQGAIENHTILDPRVQVEASVWLPPGADLDRAIELITDEEKEITATVVETDKEGVRLSATSWTSSPRERGKAAAELRRDWLRLLREHGLSSAEASP